MTVFGEQIGFDGETDSMDSILDVARLWFSQQSKPRTGARD